MRFLKQDITEVMKAVRDYIKTRALPEKEARMVERIMDMYMNTPYVYNKLVVYIRSDFSKEAAFPWKLGKKAIFVRTKDGDSLPTVMHATLGNIATLYDLQVNNSFTLVRDLMIINDINITYTTGVYDFIRELYLEGCCKKLATVPHSFKVSDELAKMGNQKAKDIELNEED